MRTALFTFLLAAVLALPATSQQDDTGAIESSLSAVVSYTSAPNDVINALLAVARRYRLPLGIEFIETGAVKAEGRSWNNVTVLTIVRDIVNTWPGYTMEISRGVVHIFPESLRNDRADVLNEHIGPFEVTDNYPPSIAAAVLPERLHALMVRPVADKPRAAMAGSILMSGNEFKVTFRMDNPTVREILDRLVQSESRNIWIVRYPASLDKTNAGYLKTLRYREATVLADWQFFPSFLLLAWGMTY
jgi:hypothetical protein